MQFLISEENLSLSVKLEKLSCKVNLINENKELKKRLQRQIKMRNVKRFSESLNLKLTEKELRRVLSGREVNIFEHPYKIIRNYSNILDYFKNEGKSKLKINLKTLKHINAILTEGYAEFWNKGIFRVPEKQPDLNYDIFANKRFDSRKLIITNMNDLEKQKSKYSMIKLLNWLISVAQVYPFERFNIQTAILVGYGIIYKSSYYKFGVVPHIELLVNYLEEAVYNRPLSNEAFNVELTKLLNIYTTYFLELSKMIEGIFNVPQNIKLQCNNRQIRLLKSLNRIGKITRREYSDNFNVSFMTAFRDLQKLVSLGCIQKYGEGRSVFYSCTPRKIKVEKTEAEKYVEKFMEE